MQYPLFDQYYKSIMEETSTDEYGIETDVQKIAKKYDMSEEDAETLVQDGTKVEKEHKSLYDVMKDVLPEEWQTPDKFYAKIATAHIIEMKDYYSKLDKMENK